MPVIVANIIAIVLSVANLLNIGSLPFQLAAMAAMVLLSVRRFVPTVVAFVLFGAPVFGWLEAVWSLSTTTCMAGLVPLLLAILLGANIGISANVKRLVRVTAFVIACYTIFAFSMLRTEVPEYAIYWWQWLLVYGVLHTLVGMVIVTKEIPISDILLPSMVFSSFLLPAMGISILELPTVASATSWGLRGANEFDAITSARAFGMLALVAAISWVRSHKQLFDCVIGSLTLTMAVPIVIYSYTRQVLLACLMTMLLLTYVQVAGSLRHLLRHITRFGLFAGLLAILAMIVVTDTMLETSRMTTAESTDGDRFELWNAAWAMIVDSPLVGHGVGAFAAAGHGNWVHNWFLEAWLEHGFALLLLFLFGTWRMARGWTHPRELPESLVGWSILSFYFTIVAQFSGDIARNSAMFLFLSIFIGAVPERQSAVDVSVVPPPHMPDQSARKHTSEFYEEPKSCVTRGVYCS